MLKKFRKTNFRKYLLFSGLSILSIFAFAAIACSSSNVVITEEDKRLKETISLITDQNTNDTQRKSISLVTDEASLKTQLRVSDDEKEKFKKYIKNNVDPNLTDEQIEKLKPWNFYFSYDLIKDKLDLNKSHYLFVKDLTDLILDSDSYSNIFHKKYEKVNKGVYLKDYKLDKETKTITLNLGYNFLPYEDHSGEITQPVVHPSHYIEPKALTSFLLPIAKNQLSNFNLNEWKIIKKFS
ncbi:hypothetical protein CJJ23_01830 [Mycoplasmopsis agassizii]|uniref:Lipoprotein n=1 Tax=Mycoplasmopsis agassizii TaxID=33922 RepID=A0A269TK21_9BACT|nr:hypothetical protein CJJ23_01830 [Mycoplasmopsis agassizii]